MSIDKPMCESQPGTEKGDSFSFAGPTLTASLDHESALVIGLGNPILGDDGVGWHVADECADRLKRESLSVPLDADCQVDCHAGGCMSLAERLIGYDRVILIDAIDTGTRPPGSISCFPLEQLGNPGPLHARSPHDTTLVTAMELERRLGARLPKSVMVVAIEAHSLYRFSEELSPAVEAAVPAAADRVISQLAEWYHH